MEAVNHSNLPEYVGRIFSEITELKQQLTQRLPEPQKPKEKLITPEAIEHLASIGYPTTEFNLNKICSLGRLDGIYSIIGGRRVFSRAKLTQWVEQGCPNMREHNAADRLAATLNK